MKNYNFLIFFILLNVTLSGQSYSEKSYWGNIGTGAIFSDFTDSDLGTSLNLSFNYGFENNIVTFSYMHSGEFLTFDSPGEFIKSYQLKYGRAFDFRMRGLIFPFPLFLMIKKDFNYSFIARIGVSYNEGIKRTTFIKDEFFGSSYNQVYVNGFGVPVEIELKEDITNYLGLGLSVFGNINAVSNYTGFSLNFYLGNF